MVLNLYIIIDNNIVRFHNTSQYRSVWFWGFFYQACMLSFLFLRERDREQGREKLRKREKIKKEKNLIKKNKESRAISECAL